MKIFFSLCIFLFFIHILPAQAQNELSFHVGLGNTKLRGDWTKIEDLVFSGSRGLSAGVNYSLQLNEDMYLGFGPVFKRIRGKLQTIDTLLSISPAISGPAGQVIVSTELRDSIDIKLDYITLPVLLNVITDNKKFHFFSGLEVGFPVKQILDNGEENIEFDEINNVNLSITFGMGYRIHVGLNHFDVNLSYTQGIVNIVETGENDTVPRVKSVDVRLSVGYSIPISRKK